MFDVMYVPITLSEVRMSACLALLMLVIAPDRMVAKTATVEQLRALIGEAAAMRRSDKDMARRISALELSERITEDTLAALQSRAAGAETAAKLADLADQSASWTPLPRNVRQ